jgi:hypothetical protein
VTSARRAILVSEETAEMPCISRYRIFRPYWKRLDDYDNAGDQPRIQWCVEHNGA